MQSFTTSEYDIPVNLHRLSAALLDSKCFEIDGKTKLLLQKASLQLSSYSYELQVSLASVYRKFYRQLEPPNWSELNLPKACELEWLKTSLIKQPGTHEGQTTAKLLRAYQELLTENVPIPCSMPAVLANSNTYALQKYGVLFLQKALSESALAPEKARSILLSLLKSDHDAIALGAIHVLEQYPMIFNRLPEKLFWILSDQNETRLQALVNILWLWGNSQLIERILEGESWVPSVKKAAIRWSAKFPLQKYLERLLELLKAHPITLGNEIVNAIKVFKLAGHGIHQKGIQTILTCYAEHPFLETEDAAFLCQNASEKNLRSFCEKHIEKTSFRRIVNLLSVLSTPVSDQILIDLYDKAQSNFERNALLDAFKNRGALALEAVVIKWFDKNPVKSVQVLSHLGGKATAHFLWNKLKQEHPKVNVYEWEEAAVKLILQVGSHTQEVLATLTAWQVPYLPSIGAEVRATPSQSLVQLLNLLAQSSWEKHELIAMHANIGVNGSQQDFDFLADGLVHENEDVRQSALNNIDVLIERLYRDKSIEPRTLLGLSCSEAIDNFRAGLIVNMFLKSKLDAQQQEFLADFLLNNVPTKLLKEHFEALVQRGNLHLEKRLIEAIGKTKAPELSPLLQKYLHKDQDIFRLRQAIIAAEKLQATHLEKDISQFLTHRNMNIRKTAASFLKHHGSQRSVPTLLHVLKTQDNVGLRDLVKEALTRILQERTVPFIYNSLRTSKSERETRLLVQALEGESRLWVEEDDSLHSILGFQELVTKTFTLPNDHNKTALSHSNTDLQEVLHELKGFINGSGKFTQSEFQKKVKALQPWNKALVFNEIRKTPEQGRGSIEFLLNLLVQNGAILSDALAIRAMGTQSDDIMSYALPHTLLLYGSYSEAVVHLPHPKWRPDLMKYFYATLKSEVRQSIQSSKDWPDLREQFEDWEYLTFFNDFHSKNQLASSHGVQLKNAGRYRKDLLHFLFDNANTETLTALLPFASKQELYEQLPQIQHLLNKANEPTQVELLQKLWKYPLIVRWLNTSTTKNKSQFHGETDRSVATRTDLTLMEGLLYQLLNEERHLLLKKNEIVYELTFILRYEEQVLTTVLSKLLELDLLWNPAFQKAKHLLADMDHILAWEALAPFVHQEHLKCLTLLDPCPSMNSKVLQTLRDGSDQVKANVLDWLLKTSSKKFYFPSLFEELCLVQPDDMYFNVALRLLLKIETNAPEMAEPVFQHITRLFRKADKVQKHEILLAIETDASNTFLRSPQRRTSFLDLFAQSDREQSVYCVLASINWHSAEDIQYVADVLRAPSSSLKTLEGVLYGTSTLKAHVRIAIYSQLLDIENFALHVQRAIIELFSQDYQIIDLLNDTQRTGFLNACSQALLLGAVHHDLAIGLCKSLSLVEAEGYIELMEKLLLDHPSRKLRSFCLRELKRGASRETYLNACMTVLKNGDASLQSQAIKALSYAKQHQVIPLLIPLLFSKKSSLQKLAENGILNVGTDSLSYLENELGKARPDKKNTIQGLIEKLN